MAEALELPFSYLNYSCAVSKETVCDILWPDADGDRANNTFKFTLHQLRRLLKKDTALTLKNGLLSLDSSCFWIDASVFMKISGEVIDLCRKTEQYMPKGGARTVGDLAGQAMELYRGTFSRPILIFPGPLRHPAFS